mmetsp:Transcript_88117/g.247825  ORF Transcript_88117/g.247825 Transcript_88117/m.247825 type:complete len:1231 (+) Transcript_88117:2-3694(+)
MAVRGRRPRFAPWGRRPSLVLAMATVILPQAAEEQLLAIFERLDTGGDGYISTLELIAVCSDENVAQFFGLEENPHPDDVVQVVRTLDADGNGSVTWDELKFWFHGLLREKAGKELTATLPPDPQWLAIGGQRRPELPLRRICNDDIQEATLRGDVGLLRRLLDEGVSLNAPIRPSCGDEYMTLLHVLASKPEIPNSTRFVREILHWRADVDAQSSFGASPLCCACHHKHLGAIEALLHYGANGSCMDDLGRTPAYYAVIPLHELQQNVAVEASLEWEQSASAVVKLLGKFKADLSKGSPPSGQPILEAMTRGSENLVEALLTSGAEPDCFHWAVKHASVNIIKKLIDHAANPFKKEKNLMVMDVAFARGEPQITDLLRDFVAQAERQPEMRNPCHWSLCSPRSSTRRSPARGSPARGSQIKRKNNAAQLDEKKRLHWIRREVRKIYRRKTFSALMFMVLIASLLLPDMYVVTQSNNVEALDLCIIIFFSCYSFEVTAQVIAFGFRTLKMPLFWADVIGVLCVPLDHSVINTFIFGKSENSQLKRTARFALLVARVGRFSKLVKLLKFLPGMQQQLARNATAEKMSTRIRELTTMWVACLTLFLCLSLPFSEFFRHPIKDNSMNSWAFLLDDTAKHHPESVSEVIDDMTAFYDGIGHYPYEVFFALANGTNRTLRLWAADQPIRILDTVVFSRGSAEVRFNFALPNRIDAVLSIVLIFVIAFIMMLASRIVVKSVRSNILDPIEAILTTVQRCAIAMTGNVAAVAMSTKIGNELVSGASHEDVEQETILEMRLLERAFKKSQALTEVAMRRKALSRLGLGFCDEDIKLLKSYDAQPGETEQQDHLGDGFEMPNAGLLEKACSLCLLSEDLTFEKLEDWNLNVVQLNELQRHKICLFALALNSAELTSGAMAISDAFIKEAEKGYKDPKQVRYHNWAHAVDVTFTLQRFLRLCSADTFMPQLERFGLVVSSLCHDIGHPGRNNAFLIETAQELAVRYNDDAPLEQMHVAKLFEIASRPRTEIFNCMDKRQYQEVRKMCIDAILNTDMARHRKAVDDLVAFSASNSRVLCSPGAPLTSEYVRLMRTSDCRRLLRTYCLHFCDIAFPMKTWVVCKHWADLLMEEFFVQGDLEKQLSIAVQPLRDREKVNMAFSQIGFIEFFVAPLVEASTSVLFGLIFCETALCETLVKWFTIWIDSRPGEQEEQRMRDRIDTVKKSLSRGNVLGKNLPPQNS